MTKEEYLKKTDSKPPDTERLRGGNQYAVRDIVFYSEKCGRRFHV